MKKIFAKLAAVIIAAMCLVSMFAVAGCTKSAKYKIGVLLYNFTDIQGKQIKEYGEYLSKDFDVSFVYVSVGADDDAHIQGLESCLNQGCNAIFSGYNTAIDTCIEKCEAAGVYYGLLLGDTAATQIDSAKLQSKYYLGGVKQFSGNPAAVGELFAQVVNATEYTKIAGISFPPFAFVDGNAIFNQFTSSVSETKTVYSAGNDPMPFPFNYNGDYWYFMFTQDACEATVTAMFTAHSDIEVVIGMGSGMDYILPALRNGNHKNVKMLALGYTDDVATYMQNGTLLAAGTNNYVHCMASLFARAYDALESDGTAWYADRAAANSEYYQYAGADGAADYTILTSVSEVTDFKTYVIGNKENGPITNEELKQCMLTFNADATWADLTSLTTKTLAQIKTARS